jgi:hypothetical protein
MRGRLRVVCADAGRIVPATSAKSAIKLRARCARILFVICVESPSRAAGNVNFNSQSVVGCRDV